MQQTADTSTRVWDWGVRIFHWTLLVTFVISYLSREQHDLHTWSGYAVIALLLFRIAWGFVGSRHARFRDFIYPPGEVWRYLKGLATGTPVHYRGHNPAGGWMVMVMLFMLVLICYTGLEALAQEGDGPLADLRLEVIATAQAHGDESHSESTSAPKVPSTDSTTASSVTENGATTVTEEEEGREEEHHEEEFWGELHHQLVNIMLGLITLHILGVIVSSALHRENLVKAMITGRKP